MKHFILLLLLLSFAINSSFANKICNAEFDPTLYPSINYNKKDIEFPLVKTPKGYAGSAVRELVRKYTKSTVYVDDIKTFDKAIDAVAEYIEKKKISPIKKADEMAEFAKSMNPIFESMIEKFPAKGTIEAPDLVAWKLRKDAIDEVKTIKYRMATKMLDFEQFKLTDYVEVQRNQFVPTKGTNESVLTHMPLEKYPNYVESRVHTIFLPDSKKGDLYNKIDQGTLGVLTLSDIRDITSYNLWPMYLKEHDMRHVHYALSHPMALAVMMRSTRSQNHLRYTMMGGLYEGVDRVQYTHETDINQFFATKLADSDYHGIKRNMDLEEAMITVALASSDDLKLLSEKAGITQTMSRFVNEVQNWKPKIVKYSKFQGKALSGLSFEDDVHKMVEKFSEYATKSEAYKLKLYENPSLLLSDEEQMFMRMMNFQITPDNPEIVIDGLLFKNDGRPHFRNWQDSMGEHPIGIGDH